MPGTVAIPARLRDQAHRFEFFQAMRMVERLNSHRPRMGTSRLPSEDPIRLGQDPQLEFPATEIARCESASDAGPPRLRLNVHGLFGPDGPMPLHFTEYVHSRLRHASDSTWSAFADMFHHRMYGLLYRAWASAQPVVGLDRPAEDRFAQRAASLCGRARAAGDDSSAADTNGKPAASALHDRLQFCGVLAGRTRHASGLSTVLSTYFAVAVSVRQFVGQWIELAEEEQTRLAGPEARPLGTGLVLGRRVWDRQHKFRVVLGPLDESALARLQPGTPAYRRLLGWVREYTGGTLDWDIEFRLAPAVGRGMRLDGKARLCRNSWLGDAPRGACRTLLFRGDATPRVTI